MEALTALQITIGIFTQLIPVWVAMGIILSISAYYRQRLGLYGHLFDSRVGTLGLLLVLFWVLTAILADLIITHDPLAQISGMKNKGIGFPVRGVDGTFYLLGGDNLAPTYFLVW